MFMVVERARQPAYTLTHTSRLRYAAKRESSDTLAVITIILSVCQCVCVYACTGTTAGDVDP